MSDIQAERSQIKGGGSGAKKRNIVMEAMNFDDDDEGEDQDQQFVRQDSVKSLDLGGGGGKNMQRMSAKHMEKSDLPDISNVSSARRYQKNVSGRYKKQSVYDDNDDDDAEDEDIIVKDKKRDSLDSPLRRSDKKQKMYTEESSHGYQESGPSFSKQDNPQNAIRKKPQEDEKYESSIEDDQLFNYDHDEEKAKKQEVVKKQQQEIFKKAASPFQKKKSIQPVESPPSSPKREKTSPKKQQRSERDSEPQEDNSSDEFEEVQDSDEEEQPKSKNAKSKERKESIEDQQQLDTQNKLFEQKKRQRNMGKTEHYFDYNDEVGDGDNFYDNKEEGVTIDELEVLHNYFGQKKSNKKRTRRLKRVAKHLRHKNMYFTSRCYMLHHLVQNIIFWLIVIICPIVSVIGCVGGHATMSHGAIALFLGLALLFDFVFAAQYYEKESLRFELRAFKNGLIDRQGRCCYMFLVFLEIIFELIMTQLGLLDIYTDVAFATLVQKEGMTTLWGVSTASIVLLMIPKWYAMGLAFMMMFKCSKFCKFEYNRRKLAFRMLTFNEYRLQAMNVEYLGYEKHKLDFLMALYKFLIEDLPQFGIQVYYLTQTDCGKKNPNTIIYLSVILAVFNTYFGLFYRLFLYVYAYKRLRAYKRKIELRVSNLQLANFGFSHIRSQVKSNKKVESLEISGETYEYFALTEEREKQLNKLLQAFQATAKQNLEIIDIKRMKIESIRLVKQLFAAIENNFQNLKFFSIQQCNLCSNFFLQLKNYLNGNDSLIRFSMIFNRLSEEDCYEVLECCLEHPNLEIIQLSESFERDQDEDFIGKDDKHRGRGVNQLSVCRGIQIRLIQNESLKKLELRFIVVNRQFIQSLFKGIAKNRYLQKLILTHGTLLNAKENDFKLLFEALASNTSLLSIDLSNNENFDNELNYHNLLTDALLSNAESSLKKIIITSSLIEVKVHYLEVIDQKNSLQVFVDEKMLEDVDVQGAHNDDDDE